MPLFLKSICVVSSLTSSWSTSPTVPARPAMSSCHLKASCDSTTFLSSSLGQTRTAFLVAKGFKSTKAEVGNHAVADNGGGNCTCEVPSEMSSCSTRPCWPQIAVKRSSHFSAAWFSTAGFSFSIGETWTLLIALGATTPCAWAMGSISGFLDRNRRSSGRDMLAKSRGGSTVWSSNQSWNHFVRSLLPAGNSIGGPPPNFASSSRSS
mmetsp:Transcript_47851/g.154200  ORF Transcript_47851/g.154200 Transcript_47851/m.154200 type:complete len:208 (+) Transcript_47851:529-1152(+)